MTVLDGMFVNVSRIKGKVSDKVAEFAPIRRLADKQIRGQLNHRLVNLRTGRFICALIMSLTAKF